MSIIWKYISNNKLITLLNIVVILILLFPYTLTFGEVYSEAHTYSWKYHYVYSDIELFVFFIPLGVLVIGFQIIKLNNWRKKLLIILTILSCLYSLNAFLTLLVPIQDYLPSWGQILMITLGPITLSVLVLELITQNDNAS